MSKKIVKCEICEKNITTRSKGKKFRHCSTDQLIDKTLISDLSREKPKNPTPKKKEEKQEITKKPEIKQSQSKDVKNEEKSTKPETKQENPESDTGEDEDGWY